MPQTVLNEILSRINAAQKELEAELDRLLQEKREQFHYSLRRGKVVFELNVRRLQRTQRISGWQYVRRAPASAILTSPFIYGMLVPIAFMDLSITVYQHICFRVYGIPLVKRNDYIVIDRHRLAYLNIIQSFNCVYCGYGNGLIEYAREVIARTEQFWCPIKHARRNKDPHHRVKKFFDYGDVDAFRNGLKKIRLDWEEDTSSDKGPGPN